MQNNFIKEAVTYDHTFDIIPFYKKVCGFLAHKNARKYEIYNEIERLYSLMNNENKSKVTLRLKYFSEELNILENHGNFHNYNDEIIIIMTKYKELCMTKEVTLTVDKNKLY